MADRDRDVARAGTEERAGPTAGDADAEPRPVPTLAVSGIVLSKAQLMDALRPYLPNIRDVRADGDGEHFTLLFGGRGSADAGQ